MEQVPGKANPVFAATMAGLLTAIYSCITSRKVPPLFSDAVHFTLSAFVCNVWSRERVYLKTAAGRNRQSVLGAVDAVTKEVFSVENKLISQRRRWKCSAKTQGHDTRYTDSGCEGSGESRAVTGT